MPVMEKAAQVDNSHPGSARCAFCGFQPGVSPGAPSHESRDDCLEFLGEESTRLRARLAAARAGFSGEPQAV